MNKHSPYVQELYSPGQELPIDGMCSTVSHRADILFSFQAYMLSGHTLPYSLLGHNCQTIGVGMKDNTNVPLRLLS